MSKLNFPVKQVKLNEIRIDGVEFIIDHIDTDFIFVSISGRNSQAIHRMCNWISTIRPLNKLNAKTFDYVKLNLCIFVDNHGINYGVYGWV